MTMKKVSGDLAKNRDYLDRQLGVGESFDVLYRNVEIGKKNAALYMIDGFCKDEVMQKLLQHFIGITKEQMPEDAAEMSRQLVPYGEVDLCDDLDEICRQVMSGVTALLLEGYEQGILIDARTYPARSVGEPEKDKVLRGSKDGFVETIVFNTALIRRRIRSTQLRMEMLQAGKTSHTDIVLCYMEDRVDQQFLEKIRNRIQNLQVDALTLNQESLAECLYQGRWWNPFPKFRFSERPDTAAAQVLEGNIIILVDNSPSALITPTSLFDVLEEADACALLPVRPADGHKGTFGHVLSVAGSEGMAGAAALCVRSALRAGAGLVTAACPFAALGTVQAQALCATAKVVADGAALDAGAADMLAELAKGKAALAIGPGLGREEGAWLAIEALVRSDTPKVVDADALYLLAKYGGGVGANTVLTPHPGEMARLCGTTVQAVLDAPVELAQQLAADMNACVLLKGATTVIAHGEDVAMNVTGCDGMGTGGCGDVLTGTIAALLAQGMSTWDAARAGAYYHGRAGEAAQARLGARGVTAWDVCEALRIE